MRSSLVSYCYKKKQHNTTEVWEWQWCHYDKYQAGNDAATETSLVSYCYKKQHNTAEVWSGNDATITIKTTVTLQVVLQDNTFSRQWRHKKDLVWSHTAITAARSHSIMGVARMPLSKLTWKLQLLNDEQYNMRTALIGHGSHKCSSVSSIKITQVGSDAASRPMRGWAESAVMPQVKLAWCRNQSRQWCRKKDLVWSPTAFIAA
jgi:hypothetical protein